MGIDDLSDVDTTGAAVGNSLVYSVPEPVEEVKYLFTELEVDLAWYFRDAYYSELSPNPEFVSWNSETGILVVSNFEGNLFENSFYLGIGNYSYSEFFGSYMIEQYAVEVINSDFERTPQTYATATALNASKFQISFDMNAIISSYGTGTVETTALVVYDSSGENAFAASKPFVYSVTQPDAVWAPEDITISSIDDISDVDTSAKADGYVLTYNGTSSEWEAAESTGGGADDNAIFKATLFFGGK